MRLLTVRQAAETLNVSTSLIYALCASKLLRHERHGIGRGKILIPEDALEEYRRTRTVEVGEAVASNGSALPLKHIRL